MFEKKEGRTFYLIIIIIGVLLLLANATYASHFSICLIVLYARHVRLRLS